MCAMTHPYVCHDSGYASAIKPWHKEYYAMLSRYMQAARFAGKDQSIMASVCLFFPPLFFTLPLFFFPRTSDKHYGLGLSFFFLFSHDSIFRLSKRIKTENKKSPHVVGNSPANADVLCVQKHTGVPTEITRVRDGAAAVTLEPREQNSDISEPVVLSAGLLALIRQLRAPSHSARARVLIGIIRARGFTAD